MIRSCDLVLPRKTVLVLKIGKTCTLIVVQPYEPPQHGKLFLGEDKTTSRNFIRSSGELCSSKQLFRLFKRFQHEGLAQDSPS